MTGRKTITAYELFAGVGGFRIALERNGIQVVWSNQWEPGQASQTASKIYVRHFGDEGHSNEDIAEALSVAEERPSLLPSAHLLVGGFPCQDYSVAKAKSQSHGIRGKKGVLWWEIFRLLDLKRPRYLILENVDRLLSSPSAQRGRDFAIMLESLVSLGYSVEWKVINAADYGFPQKRKRLFIFAEHGDKNNNLEQFQARASLLHKAFPSTFAGPLRSLQMSGDIFDTSSNFNLRNRPKPFENHGCCSLHGLLMAQTHPISEPQVNLETILVSESRVDENFWIPDSEVDKWAFLKGAKSIARRDKTTGFEYQYKEGKMAFPDRLDAPGRTIVTGEGGKTPSRFKHIILQAGRLRRLVPLELERMNGFPDDWTAKNSDGELIPASQRAFLMGNALVVGVVERIAEQLVAKHQDSK